uniref:Protein SVP26 n=1 Tax=Candidozyma auris TaxID=498019 RepID=A0A0L0P091_CANAR
MFLQVLSVLGSIVGFLFLVLSIASGLYYISELVEEHTEPTKRLLRRLIYGVTITLALLMIFDGFPKKLTFFSIFTYWVYLQNLEKFPYVQLTSPIFLASCVLVVANHFLWYDHFHNPYIPSIEERLLPSYTPPRIPSFVEVCSFFGLCVWFVPFALFVSLSANDNLLPHHMEVPEGKRKKKVGLAKLVVTTAREYVYAISRKLGYELDPHYGTII